MKKTNLIILIVSTTLILGLLGTLLWFQCFNPYRGLPEHIDYSLSYQTLLSTEDALEDFDFAFDMVKSRHPIWLEKGTTAKEIKQSFINLYNEKREALSQKEEISVSELYQQTAELLANLGDGHTRCQYAQKEPYTISDFSYINCFGNPVAINGIDIEEIYQIFLTRHSYEVDLNLKEQFFTSYIIQEKILNLLGIDTSEGVTFTYQTKNGDIDISHKFVPYSRAFTPPLFYKKNILLSHGYSEEEVYEKFPLPTEDDTNSTENTDIKIFGDPNSFVYYQINYRYKFAILFITECTFNNHYVETVKAFFKDVTDAQITNIAVDLRSNGGGVDAVPIEFLRHLDIDSYKSWDVDVRYGPFLKRHRNSIEKNKKYETNYSGNLYILTSHNTYSAARDFAMYVADNNLGKIIGEPSTNKANGYCDSLRFFSPNSHLMIDVSFKKVYRIDQTKEDLIQPDYPCESKDVVNVFANAAVYDQLIRGSYFDNTLPLETILTTEQALEDLDIAFEKLKSIHPVWIEETEKAENSREKLSKFHKAARENLSKKSETSVLELYQILSEFYAILKDGHTTCATSLKENLYIDNFMYLYNFKIPKAINGIDTKYYFEIFKTRTSYETEIVLEDRFLEKLYTLDGIQFLDIEYSDGVSFSYETKNGIKEVIHYFNEKEHPQKPTEDKIQSFLLDEGYSEKEIQDEFLKKSLKADSIENVKIVGDKSDLCWYTIDSQNDIGIFTLTQCILNDDYIKLLKDFFKDVENTKISNIAMDLRNNDGGNSSVAYEFIKYLNVKSYETFTSEIRDKSKFIKNKDSTINNESIYSNFSGKVYILTDNRTYSASMIFAQIIQDNNIGKIIGEPSTNKPNCYSAVFTPMPQLPNSKLILRISTEIQHRIDQTKGDALLEPDFPCESSQAINLLYDIVQDN